MKEIEWITEWPDALTNTTSTQLQFYPQDTHTFSNFTIQPIIKPHWLPDACERERYEPKWHKLQSYKIQMSKMWDCKHELAEFGMMEGIMVYDWYCKFCGKMEDLW